MFKCLKNLIPQQKSYSQLLEEYVVSKNPTSIQEVEHWVREYERHQGGHYGI